MAQTFSLTKLNVAGVNKQYSGGKTVNKVLFASCVGPASSVSAGMTINLGTYFTSVYAGRIVGMKGTPNSDFDWHYEPSATWAAATGKMVCVRRSTGALLSSNVVCTGERLIMEFQGDD